MTLPTTYSWSEVGAPLKVEYEAPQGRRVNVIGGYFSHGPQAGRFAWDSYASVPKPTGKGERKTATEIAAAQGLSPACLGPIDSARFLAFVWKLAGRPAEASESWCRSCPLVIVLDNYSVHKSQPVKEALPALEAANVSLFYLPSYSPELSAIEPVWRSVKGHGMPYRSETVLGLRKQAVDDALQRKALQLLADKAKTTNFEGRHT
jgi:hypothetical protein